MKNRMLWALLGLNVVLLAILVAQVTTDPAVAQVRRPADYIMVPGEVIGGQSAVVYVIDATNGQLGAMTYDQARDELQFMPPIDLARVFGGGGEDGPIGRQGRPVR
jgi:hypothetical protein